MIFLFSNDSSFETQMKKGELNIVKKVSDESARSSAQSFQEQPLSTLVSRSPLLFVFAIMIFYFSLQQGFPPLPTIEAK